MKYAITIFYVFAAHLMLSQNMAAQKPGTLDESFGTNGKYIFSEGYISTVLPNDEIVSFGGNDLDSVESILLAKFKKDGGLDVSFGNEGVVTTDIANYYVVVTKAIAAQTDGKILALIDMRVFDAETLIVNAALGVLRYNDNGVLDSSFGVNGMAVTILGKGSGEHQPRISANVMAVQPDGKILISGTYTDDWMYGGDDVLLVRYTETGKPDDSFGENGISLIDKRYYDGVYDMQLMNDGKIIIASVEGYNSYLLRIQRNGSVDSSFGENGQLQPVPPTSNGGFTINHLALQNNGRLISAGHSGFGIAIGRYNEDGSLDRTFGNKGEGLIELDKRYLTPVDITVQENNKIVVGGTIEDRAGTYSHLLWCVLMTEQEGSLIILLETVRITTTNFDDVIGGPSDENARSLELQSDGKIILGGRTFTGVYPDNRSYFALARYYGDDIQNPAITKIKTWVRSNMLGWYAANSQNVNYYNVQRSEDGSRYRNIKRVKAENVPSLFQQAQHNETGTYNYMLSSSNNQSYYRVEAVKKDGSSAYSDAVYYKGSAGLITLYPNPVKEILNVSGLKQLEKTTLTIINGQGNVLKSITVNANSYRLNVSQLPRGTYHIKIDSGGQSNTYQFIKE